MNTVALSTLKEYLARQKERLYIPDPNGSRTSQEQAANILADRIGWITISPSVYNGYYHVAFYPVDIPVPSHRKEEEDWISEELPVAWMRNTKEDFLKYTLHMLLGMSEEDVVYFKMTGDWSVLIAKVVP
jgi:hypothetical protein